LMIVTSNWCKFGGNCGMVQNTYKEGSKNVKLTNSVQI